MQVLQGLVLAGAAIVFTFFLIWFLTGVCLNPKCPKCGKARLKGDGGNGYKCPICGHEGRWGNPC